MAIRFTAIVTARAALLAGTALTLAACASTIADLPTPIGLPDAAPQRSATPPAFPAVYDTPPERSKATLTEDEQKRIERDLAATRDRQNQRAVILKKQPLADDPIPVTAGTARNP